MLSSLLLLSSSLAAASAACSRDALKDLTARFLKAQTAGNTTSLHLTPNATYIENDVHVAPTNPGLLSKPLVIDFSRSFHDPEACATLTEFVVTDKAHPYVVFTRLQSAATNVTELGVTAIDSVVTDDGDWVFNAAIFLQWTKQENWTTIPVEKQDSRATIQRAADLYLDSWGINSTAEVPYGTPCARLEGGLYTGSSRPTANTCRMPAFPQKLLVGNRRYVIDQELGAAAVLNGFPWLEASKPGDFQTPSGNLVRVEGGLMRYVHELTVCLTKNCGR